MSLSKDLTTTVTNDAEGSTIVLKTVSAVGKDKIFISGDGAIYDIKEIKEAIKGIEEFFKLKEPEEEILEGIHLP